MFNTPVARLALTVCLLIGSAAAQCGLQQLTTPPAFASNNGGASGGLVYFTLDVLAQSGISICGIGLNTTALGAIDAKVYRHLAVTDVNLLNGTNNGAANWCTIACLAGVAQPVDTPSPMTVINGTATIDLPPGQHLLAIGNGNFNHRYTLGTGSNHIGGDVNLRFVGGKSSNIPFSNNLLDPRILNAVFDYDVRAQPVTQSPCGTNCVAALCTRVGSGCGGAGALVYELFTATNAWDLSDPIAPTALDLALVASGGNITVTTSPGTAIVPAISADLGLADDDASAPIDVGFGLDAFGSCSHEISVCSNGSIFFGGTGDTTFTESPTTLNNETVVRFAPYWDDLQPASGGGASGTIHVDLGLGQAIITYDQVALWGTSNSVTFQVVLTPTSIRVRYDPLSSFASSALVGYHNGVALAPLPPGSDLSNGGVALLAGAPNLSLRCDARPVANSALRMTLAGVPVGGIGAVLAEIGPPGPGAPLSTPPFATGCVQYLLGGGISLGVTFACDTAYAIPIPGAPGLLNLPIALQGAALSPTPFAVMTSNGLAARLGNY